jgi:5'/3'-nucleotidase SurE
LDVPPCRIRKRRLRQLLSGGCALVCLFGPARLSAQTLGILLTNDDGFEAPGLTTLAAALTAAGHSVTIVAPLDDRSGSGMSMTTGGTIDYYRQEEGVWAIDGTPSDAVTLGLVHVLRDSPPDLVISGMNFGHNVGANLGSSGTVGAAITGARAGVPAIAVSVAIDSREADGATPFASTTAAFEPAAAFVVEVVRQLAETGGAGILPPRAVLNVNYPAVGGAEPEGVRFATVSSLRGFRQVFSVAGDTGPARVETVPANTDRAEEGSDLALVTTGFVTISVLDGDWDAGSASWEPLLARLIIER